MIRRMDVSATLKAFTVVIAFLTVLISLCSVYGFVIEVLHDDYGYGEPADWVFLAAVLAAGTVAALTPLAFIVWDWMMRKPWRATAAVTGGLLGGLIVGVLGFLLALAADLGFQSDSLGPYSSRGLMVGVSLLGFALLIMWMTAKPGWFSRALGTALIVLLAAASLYSVDFLMGEAGLTAEDASRSDKISAAMTLVSVLFLSWILVRAVRHRIVLSGDVPREVLLGALPRKRFWARIGFLAGLPASLWHAAAMKTPAFWCFLLARPAVYAGALSLFGGQTASERKAMLIIGLSLIVAGHVLFAVAKRLAAWYLWLPTEGDESRPPILFLRTFQDDQFAFGRNWWRLHELWFDLWSFRRNADEAMIDEIAQYGPVVALGVPGEKKVPFGAQRHYAAHDDWKSVIKDTARKSRAVVVGASATPSVVWEYQMLAEEGLLDKVLLLIPPPGKTTPADRVLLDTFAEATGVHLQFEGAPGKHLIALLPASGGHAVLTADEDGAAAYVAALRAHFQQCAPQRLAGIIADERAARGVQGSSVTSG
jgi:hypothetical protein